MNNTEENNSFPTVDNIVVNDTPVESFDNLYRNNNNMNQMNMTSENIFGTSMNEVPQNNNVGMNQVNMATDNPFGTSTNEEPQNNNVGMNQVNMATENPFGTSMNDIPQNNMNNVIIDDKKMMSIEEQLSKTSQYNPDDFQQEKITIPTDNQYEKNKSGLTFIIILFVLLGVVIAFLPQLTKLIK